MFIFPRRSWKCYLDKKMHQQKINNLKNPNKKWIVFGKGKSDLDK
jgi:soluble P-type ATPase